MSKRSDIGDGFDPKRPHFFKVIVEETLRDKKMMLPEKFVGEHGGTLSSPVSINVPGGMTWQIQMSKARTRNAGNGRTKNIYLVNETWKEFVTHYSLKHGHFLIFQYEGGSRFSVAIFDGTNGSEIEYPVSNKGITTTTGKNSSSSKFTSKYPFFRVVITDSHLLKSNVNVPRRFADKYLKRSQQVKLQVGDDCWKVNANKMKGGPMAVQLNRGFRVFGRESSIKAGNVCYFELVGSKDGDQTYKVTISKEN
ncbi:unnamed protein product [Linum trigynum]|uniref:TF-B3 domain-containing protein n=1 Tax=Linum trigynum TaxID=586398 RepID=A0AAV2C6F3_9ROSI